MVSFGDSKHFPVKLQIIMIRARTLVNPLPAKCFIYDVTAWCSVIRFSKLIGKYLCKLLFHKIQAMLCPKQMLFWYTQKKIDLNSIFQHFSLLVKGRNECVLFDESFFNICYNSVHFFDFLYEKSKLFYFKTFPMPPPK